MTPNNVISLATRRQPVDVSDDEQERIEAVIDEVMSSMLETATYYDCSIKNTHDLGLICETVRSGMYRDLGKKHALQDLADNIIQIVD